ncbi:acetylserotonin O-methyltransferase-like [Corylus avellana]|uniref:acetylserotonin O-methyltransferase-like n=1 Tax=Corylus avellana TaxID=13451 RepID=UPI001E211E60|nr:acetylserotonin O-methyltransferase-like [Corylus avellana]
MEEKQREATWQEEEEQAEVAIWKYAFGFTEMAVVKCTIELGIADAIESHGSPMTLSELSSALACAPSPLYCIMRFLMHREIFKEELTTAHGSPGYAQTALSRRLMRHGERSVAALILLESSPVMLAPWHSLSARVLANETSPFDAAHGEDVWSYAAENPAHSQLINEAMACDARLAVPAMIHDCPEVFDGLGSLVDVGGGNGTTLQTLVKAFPWLRGINFDLPHVVSVATESIEVEHVGGDMFLSVPKADAVFLKWVLHDWGDKECIQILKKCREAIPEDKGKVIIVEAVIEEAETDKLTDVRLALDMIVMAHTNTGKERTFKEWGFVLGKAGFCRYTVKPIRAVQSVIEAFP